MKVEKMIEILNSGVWGTIGPISVASAQKLAARARGKYGLLTHSSGAAVEAVLRALNITRGGYSRRR